MGILRFLLAFLVVMTHYSGGAFGLKLMPGYVCVEMFFVISGYYMCFILSENKYLKIKKFYASRFFRLYPLFLCISLLLLLKMLLFETITGKEVMTGLTFPYSPLWLKIVSTISNLSMFGQDLFSLFHINAQHQIQFFHSNDLNGSDYLGYSWGGELRWNGPAWSIGAEIWFYLLVPFMFKLTNRWLMFLIILSLLLKLYLEIKVDYSTYFFFPAQIYLFIIGMLCYRYRKIKLNLSRFISPILASFLFVFIFIYMYSPYQSTLRYLMPLLLAFNINFLFSLTSKRKWDRLLGELSYPIYISHMLILTTFHDLNSKYELVLNPNLILLITISIIIIFSIIWNNYIESFINQLRWKYFAN